MRRPIVGCIAELLMPRPSRTDATPTYDGPRWPEPRVSCASILLKYVRMVPSNAMSLLSELLLIDISPGVLAECDAETQLSSIPKAVIYFLYASHCFVVKYKDSLAD